MRRYCLALVVALIVTTPIGPAAPQGDCGTGADAPDLAADATEIDVPVLACEGAVDPVHGDPSDWFSFDVTAGTRISLLLNATGPEDLRLCLFGPEGAMRNCASAAAPSGAFPGSLARVYGTANVSGTYEVQVVWTRWKSTYPPLTYKLDAQWNHVPETSLLWCSLFPTRDRHTEQCSLGAWDDSRGVAFELDWGDGSPIDRVPPTGFLSRYANFSTDSFLANQRHTYAELQDHTIAVVAVDDDSLAPEGLRSAPRSLFVPFVANTPPHDVGLACTTPVVEHVPASCALTTEDDSIGLHWSIDWGDGTVVREPPFSGDVDHDAPVNVSHTWSTRGVHSVEIVATDWEIPPLSSPPFLTSIRVFRVQSFGGTVLLPTGLDLAEAHGPGGVGDGIDGRWIELEENATGTEPVRFSFNASASDLELSFRSWDLGEIDAPGCAPSAPGSVACFAPFGAHWAFVRSRAGASSSFQFTYLY